MMMTLWRKNMNLSFDTKNKLYKFIYKLSDNIFVFQVESNSIIFFFDDGERVELEQNEALAFVELYKKLINKMIDKDIWNLDEIKKVLFK